jgi:hypothetical protein
MGEWCDLADRGRRRQSGGYAGVTADLVDNKTGADDLCPCGGYDLVW